MKEELLELFQKKDREFVSFARKLEFSAKYHAQYNSLLREMSNLINQMENEGIDKKEIEKRISYYEKLLSIQKRIKEMYKTNYKKSNDFPHYFQLIKLLTKYEEGISEPFEKLKNRENASQIVSSWHANQDGINAFYKRLCETDEDILKEELPREQKEESKEEYQNYLYSFYEKPVKEQIEEPEVNPIDLIDESLLTEWLTPIVPQVEEQEIIEKEEPALGIQELMEEEKKVSPSLEEIEAQNESVMEYLRNLYKAMDDYNQMKKKVVEFIGNNEEVPKELLENYNRERENQDIYTKEINRSIKITKDDLAKFSLTELKIPTKEMDFKKVIECKKMGISLEEYDKISLMNNPKEPENQVKEVKKEEPKQEEVSEIKLIGNLHRAIRDYEQFTNNKVSVDIKKPKEKKPGKKFNFLRKASNEMIDFFKVHRKKLIAGAIGSFAISLGLLTPSVAKNLSKKYEPVITGPKVELADQRILIEEPQENEMPNQSIPQEEFAKEALQEIGNKMDLNLTIEETKEEAIELPFSLGNDEFTILPGASVYTDEYLGYDGNLTGHTPLYSSDTIRIPEEAIIKMEDANIKRVYNDEAFQEALNSGGDVIGVNAFDGFYRIEETSLFKEREMHR